MAKPQVNFINESSVLCGAHALYATKNKPTLPANFATLSDADKVAALVTAWRGVSWTNCGALDEGKLSGENKSGKREVQNVADKTIVTDQSVKYTAKLYELMNPVVEPILGAGLSSFTNIPGTAVTGADNDQDALILRMENVKKLFHNTFGSVGGELVADMKVVLEVGPSKNEGGLWEAHTDLRIYYR